METIKILSTYVSWDDQKHLDREEVTHNVVVKLLETSARYGHYSEFTIEVTNNPEEERTEYVLKIN